MSNDGFYTGKMALVTTAGNDFGPAEEIGGQPLAVAGGDWRDAEAREIPTGAGLNVWGAVSSMARRIALLFAAEFVSVSLLTPTAGDLGTTAGMAGQAISI